MIGLKGVTYVDSLAGKAEVVEAGEQVAFGAEADRIYRAAPDQLQVGPSAGGGRAWGMGGM